MRCEHSRRALEGWERHVRRIRILPQCDLFGRHKQVVSSSGRTSGICCASADCVLDSHLKCSLTWSESSIEKAATLLEWLHRLATKKRPALSRAFVMFYPLLQLGYRSWQRRLALRLALASPRRARNDHRTLERCSQAETFNADKTAIVMAEKSDSVARNG